MRIEKEFIRINKYYAYFRLSNEQNMKARLNITIEESLLSNIKVYALRNNKSVSELVEEYFKSISKPSKRKNILQLVEKLEKPTIDLSVDLKDSFYKDQAKKYGF